MNHALFWLTPRARPASCEETPFLLFAISQTAGSHLSRPSGLSSKIVPNLTEYCFLQPLHFQRRRVFRYEFSWQPHSGHVGPSGHRSLATYSVATSMSVKKRTASMRLVGSGVVVM